MKFVTMDPEVAAKAIEGIDDELSPALKKEEAFKRQFSKCRRCGGDMVDHWVSHEFAYAGNSIIPRTALECTNCKMVYDPHSDLVLETPTGEFSPFVVSPIVGLE